MSMTEKVAYLKGLADGIGLDEKDNNGKLLKAIIDTLDEIAGTVDDIDEDLDVFAEQLDAVDEDLAEVESYVYGDDDCDCDCDCCDDDFGDEEEYYDVECPGCGEVICIDEDILEEGSIECPNCGELLEFDIECDCDCECGCDDCDED